MLKEVLSKCLTPRQRANGLYLEMENDHILALKRMNEVLRVFNNRLNEAQIVAIQQEADRWVEPEFVGITFVKKG